MFHYFHHLFWGTPIFGNTPMFRFLGPSHFCCQKTPKPKALPNMWRSRHAPGRRPGNLFFFEKRRKNRGKLKVGVQPLKRLGGGLLNQGCWMTLGFANRFDWWFRFQVVVLHVNASMEIYWMEMVFNGKTPLHLNLSKKNKHRPHLNHIFHH